ncbi:hypothetical protein LOK49_LG08G01845 [Camellia lanceoleosa]|uniref:Uncharacterized protein n=1 Tax=Camellia lanceoleosa TaxID=1840588 RepID=A0ACC0GNS3_9ERIC|nr:hypothetical protein LOK49_LG08G01845 [Camellia lanceoleosa]
MKLIVRRWGRRRRESTLISPARAMFSNCKPQIEVNNGHKMIVNPAGRCTMSASSDRLENRVQDVDEGIGQIDVNNGFLGTSSEIDDDGQIDSKSEYKTMMKESDRST